MRRLRSLSLTLPQIRISVIKLIKVMHANMPLGSRPDFICHTFVESCPSFTFDVAFYIIENNWIPSPPSTLPCLVHTQIHTEFAHVLSGHALLIDPLCCRSVSVASKGFSGVSAAWGQSAALENKSRDLSSPAGGPRDSTSARVKGDSAGWTGACQWARVLRPVGAVPEPIGALLLYLRISLAEHEKRACLAHRQLASLHTQRKGW